MGVPFARISLRVRIALGPNHSGVEPDRGKEKGCNWIFQSGYQDCDKIARKCFQDLLVGPLDAVEGLGVLASPLYFLEWTSKMQQSEENDGMIEQSEK